MRVLKILVVLFVVLAIAGGAFAWTAFSGLQTPAEHNASTQAINIPDGSTPEQIVKLLRTRGILKEALPLQMYIRFTRSGPLLKAGDYIFPSPISPLEVLKKLEDGGQGALKLTIVEGWNRWDIANAMAKTPTLRLLSSNQALRMMTDTRMIKDIDPAAPSLEGYMFPSTYFLLSNSLAEDVLAQAVKEFRAEWKRELEPLFKLQSRSLHEIVVIASIVETEAKKKEERPIIASVIYNRLDKKMPLGMDCTVVYASKIAGKWHNDGKVYQSDIDRNSPYNTRKIVGLPIGPVGCPGLASLKAALQPAKTNYIYYVRNPADNGGSHNFYSDEAKFNAGVQGLRNWEKQRDAAEKRAGAKH